MIFVPIVFSVTASSLIYTQIFALDPHIGVVNAVIQTVDDWVHPPGSYPLSSGQTASSLIASGGVAGPVGSIDSSAAVAAGGTVKIGITGISPETLSALGALPAKAPTGASGKVNGLVWRAFSPSNPTNTTEVFPDEVGLPNLEVALINSHGDSTATVHTDSHGNFSFSNVGSGSLPRQDYSLQLPDRVYRHCLAGPQSLTPTSSLSQTGQALLSVPLVTISMILAYLWIWAGFTMVVVAAGLAALDREVLEASHVDGATEWQTFRRITMPMLAPVLTVVLVTMVINVLKIFDIIINLGANNSEPGGQASTLASNVYYLGFGGGVHTGLASALAVILFILVIPAMLFNLKRIRGQ